MAILKTVTGSVNAIVKEEELQAKPVEEKEKEEPKKEETND